MLKKEAEEQVLFDYFVDLRSFLDGDHLQRQDFQKTYRRPLTEANGAKAEKKNKKAEEGRATSGKSTKAKNKGLQTILLVVLVRDECRCSFLEKKGAGETADESPPMEDVSLRSSIEFQLHRYVSSAEIV